MQYYFIQEILVSGWIIDAAAGPRVAKKVRAHRHCPRGRFTIGEVSEEGLVANGR